MADMKKVINGLECVAQKREPTANPCNGCGYIDRSNFAMCVKDIASDALELLKEHEAVEPRNTYSTTPSGKVIPHIFCGKCDKEIFAIYDFCPFCGQAVKWE